MKSKTFLIISTFLISFVLSCDSNGSVILRILKEIEDSLPELIKQVKNMKECQTAKLKPICSKGYSYWHSLSEAQVYKGIERDKESVEGFFSVLMDGLPIDVDDAKKILSYFKTMAKAKSSFTELLGLDVIYHKNSRASANKGCYFSILMESDCENKSEFDFLFTYIKTNFELGKDIFLKDSGHGNIFSGTYEQEIVVGDPDLSREQYKALFNLLQLSSYSNAAELINNIKP